MGHSFPFPLFVLLEAFSFPFPFAFPNLLSSSASKVTCEKLKAALADVDFLEAGKSCFWETGKSRFWEVGKSRLLGNPEFRDLEIQRFGIQKMENFKIL